PATVTMTMSSGPLVVKPTGITTRPAIAQDAIIDFLRPNRSPTNPNVYSPIRGPRPLEKPTSREYSSEPKLWCGSNTPGYGRSGGGSIMRQAPQNPCARNMYRQW